MGTPSTSERGDSVFGGRGVVRGGASTDKSRRPRGGERASLGGQSRSTERDCPPKISNEL
jgi:hypothetical protein